MKVSYFETGRYQAPADTRSAPSRFATLILHYRRGRAAATPSFVVKQGSVSAEIDSYGGVDAIALMAMKRLHPPGKYPDRSTM